MLFLRFSMLCYAFVTFYYFSLYDKLEYDQFWFESKHVFENKNNTHNNAPHRGNRGSILIPEFDLVEKHQPETPNVSNDQMYQHNMTPAIINNHDLDSCTNPSIASLQDSDIQQLSSPKATHRKVILTNSPSIEKRKRTKMSRFPMINTDSLTNCG